MIRVRASGGIFAATVFCDACRKPIEDGQGNAEWLVPVAGDLDDPYGLAPVFHTHKSACSEILRRRYERPGALMASEDLDQHLLFVAGNAGVDWREAERHARELADVGLVSLPHRRRSRGR